MTKCYPSPDPLSLFSTTSNLSMPSTPPPNFISPSTLSLIKSMSFKLRSSLSKLLLLVAVKYLLIHHGCNPKDGTIKPGLPSYRFRTRAQSLSAVQARSVDKYYDNIGDVYTYIYFYIQYVSEYVFTHTCRYKHICRWIYRHTRWTHPTHDTPSNITVMRLHIYVFKCVHTHT